MRLPITVVTGLEGVAARAAQVDMETMGGMAQVGTVLVRIVITMPWHIKAATGDGHRIILRREAGEAEAGD